jgi:hypothetical protein
MPDPTFEGLGRRDLVKIWLRKGVGYWSIANVGGLGRLDFPTLEFSESSFFTEAANGLGTVSHGLGFVIELHLIIFVGIRRYQ